MEETRKKEGGKQIVVSTNEEVVDWRSSANWDQMLKDARHERKRGRRVKF